MTNVVNMQKHNSAPDRARKALDNIDADRGNLWKHWLDYGEALNDMREQYASDEQFGQQVSKTGLDKFGVGQNGHHQTVHPKARQAAMWAAANPDELRTVSNENSEVTPKGGFRSLHTKWKTAQKTPTTPAKTKSKSKSKSKSDDEPLVERQEIFLRIVVAAGDDGISQKDIVDAMVAEGELEKGHSRNGNIVKGAFGTLAAKRLVTANEDGTVRLWDKTGDVDTLPATDKEKLERLKKRLTSDFDHRVRVEATKMLHDWRSRELKNITARIDAVLKLPPKLTPDAYKDIIRVLHPTGGESPKEMERKTRAKAAFENLGLVPLTQEEMDQMADFKRRSEEFMKMARENDPSRK